MDKTPWIQDLIQTSAVWHEAFEDTKPRLLPSTSRVDYCLHHGSEQKSRLAAPEQNLEFKHGWSTLV